LSEEVSYLPDVVTMVCKDGPFYVVICILSYDTVWDSSVLLFVCFSSLVMICFGYLLLLAMSCILIRSVFLFSKVSGRAVILLIRWRYAAILCSVGWFDMKLIVVSVAVGLRWMSISIWFCVSLVVGPESLHCCFLQPWG
jgi:hypothetical protein